ncbi:25596_t:CDS:2 [Dentiscutata erythropus]|uniref:25596_t:CDS:1 n=1 Tax=Dentiscutata erythropus TaxID=1348616 RepID=A0A9N9HY68_9GLOM|nr:25596_t:CDS:2 [Dentiscutata erythropus]
MSNLNAIHKEVKVEDENGGEKVKEHEVEVGVLDLENLQQEIEKLKHKCILEGKLNPDNTLPTSNVDPNSNTPN